jgi:predicted metal-dependent hydrolase
MKEFINGSKQPASETIKIASVDRDGNEGAMVEWKVSHSSGDMVYLKHNYDTADEARFIYRGMTRARYAELGGYATASTPILPEDESGPFKKPTIDSPLRPNVSEKQATAPDEEKTNIPFTVQEARNLLNYTDIGEEDDEEWMNEPESLVFTNEIIELSKIHGQDEVIKLSDEIRTDYDEAMNHVNFKPGNYPMGKSVSWSMEAIAEQSYLAKNPEAAKSRGYVVADKLSDPFDPKNRAAKVREMSSRQIGFEFQNAITTAAHEAVKGLSYEDRVSAEGIQKQVDAKRTIVRAAVQRDGKREMLEKLVNASKGPLSPEISHTIGELLRLEKVAKKGYERTSGHELPKTFAEVRSLPGHSIESLLDKTGDLSAPTKNWYSTSLDELISNRLRNNSFRDKRFMSDVENIIAYERDIHGFSIKLHNENPYRNQRGVLHSHIGWTQHDSKEFIRSRVEKEPKETADSRFYLNPPVENMVAIYKEIFGRAEAQGLKFQAKVLDFDLRGRGQRKTVEDQREKAEKWSKNPSLRNDPMVFYGFLESKERLYEIIKDVYISNEQVFKGRELGFAPYELAPGFGVGEEPRELSGRESLSSFLESILASVTRNSDWKQGKTPADRKKRFAGAFRKKISDEKLPINPDNIAFR